MHTDPKNLRLLVQVIPGVSEPKQMIWKIVDTPHRLIGSIHVLPKNTTLPNWATESHDGIKRFVFEADHRSPLIREMEIGIDRTEAHLEWSGVSQAYLKASELLDSHGINIPFNAFLPWRAAFFVMAQLLPIYGLSHDHGMDNRLRTMADSNGLKINFLEHPTRAFELIDSSCQHAQSGVAFFEDVVANAKSGVGLLELQRIIRAWFTSDLADFTAIHNEKLIQFPFMFEALITQRNLEWITVARKLITDKTPTLFIVGSLHTVGAGSFIEQLEISGIRLTRVATN